MTVSALRLKNFIAVFNQFGYQSGTIEGKTTLNDIADWRESNNYQIVVIDWVLCDRL